MSYIKNFQEKYNLKPDGILGKNTALKIKEVCKIDTEKQLAHFLGQCHHESLGFTVGRENLNYSRDGLLRTFPKYFNFKSASKYNRNPQGIANIVYNNRMGNTLPNDGYKYRGVGPLQLTGHNNIAKFALSVDNSLVIDNPDIILEEYYFESAVWYFDTNSLWKYCIDITDNSILTLSKAINLGRTNTNIVPNGFNDRVRWTKYYYNLIKE